MSQMKAGSRSQGAKAHRSCGQLAFTPAMHARAAGPTPYSRAIHALRVQEQRAQQFSSNLRCAAAAPAAEAAPAPTGSESGAPVDPATMDIRVGRIVKIELHPEADSLYVEQIDVGEPEARTIVSGLVGFVPLEQMQDRKVVVLCNLKPRNMRGIKSNGMVLCASNDAHSVVEPLDPPAEAAVGERVYFGEGGKTQAAPAEPNRVQKKKLWEAVMPLLKTDSEAVARFGEATMFTSAGPVRVASLGNASIA
ncbi:Tyrosine--tRNA ligase, cytoplasmic [Tetrabaena socialis]|uniref:Tyrosine--tRNA ligase, cytoplasmic n=1 Tax=Tetrabaena socialis TaxID=47790 RepID=A0A2J8A848_9CHLO|nr:Tyrosine--tRNA ligase, cytoplasmic [Tetrabaena socialis]|eukprot:PNH08706.1 Tyrosine--tRNA ligase, cytoplasmic [Tetrabaena socialis]